MNNRWIYGLELLVFGWISLRGGWLALRGFTLWSRLVGTLALLCGAATVALLGAFVANVAIPPLFHFTPLVGVVLVFLNETVQAARLAPDWTAPFVGLYGTLALLAARRPPATPGPSAEEADEDA